MELKELLNYQNIVVQCHDNPDADTVASGYAVYEYLKKHDDDSFFEEIFLLCIPCTTECPQKVDTTPRSGVVWRRSADKSGRNFIACHNCFLRMIPLK